MHRRLKLTFFFLILITSGSFAQNYSIPVDSWIYPAIQQLQTGGYLMDLSPGFKPYTRREVAKSLKNLQDTLRMATLPEADKWLIAKLDDEFSYELSLVKAESASPDTTFTGGRFSEEVFLNLAKGHYAPFKYAGKPEFRPTLRSEFGFSFGNDLTLYTDATIDQTLKDDTLYSGSTKFGLDALHQQAYLRYSSRYMDFTFGRDYLSWGYGDNGSVLVSPTAGALDMASLLVRTKVVKFNWFVAQLNPMPEFTPDTANYGPFGPAPTFGKPDPPANRYFTGSRFEFNIAGKVFVGAYQAAVFGGPDAPIDLELINPLRVNFETAANEKKASNNFVGADVSVFWPKNFNFYSDLMIDDWQVDHKTRIDLKPNQYALNLGVRVWQCKLVCGN